MAESFCDEDFIWSYHGLDKWNTDAIVDRLRTFGIDIDERRFEEQARQAGRVMQLERQWCERIDVDKHGPWIDFPYLACIELWRRLAPGLVCPEIIAHRVNDTIDRALSSDDLADPKSGRDEFDSAMEFMDYLERFDVGDRQSALDDVLACSAYELGEWLADIIADYGHNFVEQSRRIADVMSETECAQDMWIDYALMLARTGRVDEGADVARRILEQWPDSIWMWIRSGDVYGALGNEGAALKCFTQALKMATDSDDWDCVAERLEPLLVQLGRRGDWDCLCDLYPKPADLPVISPSYMNDASVGAGDLPDLRGPIGVITSEGDLDIGPNRISPVIATHKAGRNDPCPCGSGMKYKKCCLRSG